MSRRLPSTERGRRTGAARSRSTLPILRRRANSRPDAVFCAGCRAAAGAPIAFAGIDAWDAGTAQCALLWEVAPDVATAGTAAREGESALEPAAGVVVAASARATLLAANGQKTGWVVARTLADAALAAIAFGATRLTADLAGGTASVIDAGLADWATDAVTGPRRWAAAAVLKITERDVRRTANAVAADPRLGAAVPAAGALILCAAAAPAGTVARHYTLRAADVVATDLSIGAAVVAARVLPVAAAAAAVDAFDAAVAPVAARAAVAAVGVGVDAAVVADRVARRGE
jgi:hypothetical protein